MAAARAFADLGLPEALVDALHRYDLVTAFPIQSATIADALAGRDVLGKARTGSGKTLGFGLPMLTRLSQLDRPEPRRPLGIVLVPTRELAMQVGDALEPYTHALGLSQRLVAGGLSMSKQIQSLERGVHLVVATPGRLADLMRRGHAILDRVAVSVLDEADHMAEMGFGEEIAEILAVTPQDGQRLLFSATLDGVVDQLVSRFMTDPVLHDVTLGTDAPTQRHVVLAIPPHEKYQLATRIAAREGRTICFVRTKLGADRVAEEMRSLGVLAVALHGDRSQYERNQAMTEFRAGRLPVLVATDVAARGIHVDAVDLVLQIDPPADYRDYTHRSGRTGRAGADGLAITLTLPHQRRQMDRILENAKIDAERAQFRTIDDAALKQIDDLTGGREPSGEPVDEPIAPPRMERGRGRRGESSPRVARHSHASDAALSARERALEDRERALVERERRLAEREQAATATERDAARATRSERPARAERPARHERGEWSDRPARGDSRPAWNDRPARGDRPTRDGDAPRSGRGQWEPRGNDRDDRPRYGDRDDRPARAQRTDRPERGAGPARGERPQRADRAPWATRDDRAPRDERGADGPEAGRKPRHRKGESRDAERPGSDGATRAPGARSYPTRGTGKAAGGKQASKKGAKGTGKPKSAGPKRPKKR